MINFHGSYKHFQC